MQGPRAIAAAIVVFTLALPLRAAMPDRTELDHAYQDELNRLAAKCDELKLPKEAAQTRAWFIERLPDRQYIFVPPERETLVVAQDAPELEQKWRAKFLELRHAQAEKLVALASDYLEAAEPTKAYQALHEALRENPDHAQARKILGYRKVNAVWRLPGASPAARKATLAHGFVKGFKPREYWRVTTPHFSIATNAGSEPGLRFGEQLELLHSVWRQAFYRYWGTLDELRPDFARPTPAERLRTPYEVVLFRHRPDYLANLATAEPRLAVTQGIYLDKRKAAFFYLGDERAEAICYHEGTHQLFQETGSVAPEIGLKQNFWIVEGVALYMESLRRFEGYVTLGGWDADRVQFARHHVFNGGFQMPLAKLTAKSREDLQQDEDIKRLYSQSAGLAHYLLDGAGGRHREETVTYLSTVYAGKDAVESLASLTELTLDKHDTAYREFLAVRDDDVVNLPAPRLVRSLCLGHQPISDASLAKIAECENLRWLDLAATKVTDAGLAKLAGLKRLDQLNLEQTAAGDATLTMLGKQTQLTELDLSHTKITDEGVKRLAGLTNLRVLWLTGTNITDASAATLLKLKKLETLDLDDTKLTPATLEKLRSSLPSLTPDP